MMNINSYIAGADLQLPTIDTIPYPRFAATEFAISRLVEVSQCALQQAGINADDIDLIISYSMSQDRFAYEKEIYGPRICHPLQKQLQMNNAFAFDLMDASSTTVFDVANSMMLEMGLEYALVVRVDVNTSLLPDPESGFAWSDGVAAAVLAYPAAVQGLSLEEKIETSVMPCILHLNEQLKDLNDSKGYISFKPTPGFHDAYHEAEQLLSQKLIEQGISQENIYSESWFMNPDTESIPIPGPYGLFQVLKGKVQAEADTPWAAITFDPYRLTLSAHVYTINGKDH